MRTADVGLKPITYRSATAFGRIKLKAETVKLIKANSLPKGNLVEATKLAGIMGAKRTPEVLPFCHPVGFDFVGVEVYVKPRAVEVVATVRGTAKTGYEMEALTAVSVALLNVYDMCKAFDDSMEIERVKLLKKTGGKSQWMKDLRGVKVKVSAPPTLKKLLEDNLKELKAQVSKTADVEIKVEDTSSEAHKTFENIVALYHFTRFPDRFSSPVVVEREGKKTLIKLPEDPEVIAFFFESFGGFLKGIT